MARRGGISHRSGRKGGGEGRRAYFAGFVLCNLMLCMLLTRLASDHGSHSQ